jgi:predicted nucleotide-binding protein
MGVTMTRRTRLRGFSAKLAFKKSSFMNGPIVDDIYSPNFRRSQRGASFAVVLITSDDEGGLSGEPPRERARQNVVFELGFFIGKLGAARVAPLVKGDVEKPSDFDGVGYIALDPNGAWKGLLARELKVAKIPFEADKVFEA